MARTTIFLMKVNRADCSKSIYVLLFSIILILANLFSCTTNTKKPEPEIKTIYKKPEEPEVLRNFEPLNAIDADALKSCHKLVINLYGTKNSETEINDPTSITELLSLINSAKTTSDHKCSSVAQLKFIAANTEVQIDLLPGHADAFYEFRYGHKNYKINREKFFEINEIKKIKDELLLNSKK